MSRCPLYPEFTLEANLAFWKTSYCESDFEACERYRLFREGKPVPLRMLPNGKQLVKSGVAPVRED